MKKIGIISDTHNDFDKSIEKFLADVDEIWHAGDFGTIELADRIAYFKPLRGVYGNIDGGTIRNAYPHSDCWRTEDLLVYMTHIGGYPGRWDKNAYADILKYQPDLVIAGHSHILKVQYDKKLDLLYINPGAAGRYGFHKVRTAVRLTIDGKRMFDLEVGEWPRI